MLEAEPCQDVSRYIQFILEALRGDPAVTGPSSYSGDDVSTLPVHFLCSGAIDSIRTAYPYEFPLALDSVEQLIAATDDGLSLYASVSLNVLTQNEITDMESSSAETGIYPVCLFALNHCLP